MKARKGASKTTREIDNKNQLEKKFISFQTFHRTPGGRVQETTAGERFRLENFKPFYLVAQASHKLHPATIHNNPTNVCTKVEAFWTTEIAAANQRLSQGSKENPGHNSPTANWVLPQAEAEESKKSWAWLKKAKSQPEQIAAATTLNKNPNSTHTDQPGN
jgi:hypothetical protein